MGASHEALWAEPQGAKGNAAAILLDRPAMEELGRRGYALPLLQAGFSPLIAALITMTASLPLGGLDCLPNY